MDKKTRVTGQFLPAGDPGSWSFELSCGRRLLLSLVSTVHPVEQLLGSNGVS